MGTAAYGQNYLFLSARISRDMVGSTISNSNIGRRDVVHPWGDRPQGSESLAGQLEALKSAGATTIYREKVSGVRGCHAETEFDARLTAGR
jgi:hypothetical protein